VMLHIKRRKLGLKCLELQHEKFFLRPHEIIDLD
jgi:hypothetical protein